MDDNSRGAKYIRLFGTIFFSIIGILIALVLLILAVRFIFGLLSYLPFSQYIYLVSIILVPGILFTSVCVYYFKRTTTYPVAFPKYLSMTLFCGMIVCWLVCMVRDMITFHNHGYTEIGKYWSFSLWMLAGSVGLIFFIGIMQALGLPGEEDWLAKNKKAAGEI